MDQHIINLMNSSYTSGLVTGLVVAFSAVWLWNKMVAEAPEEVQIAPVKVPHLYDWEKEGPCPGMATKKENRK